jgi:hypothetical protein
MDLYLQRKSEERAMSLSTFCSVKLDFITAQKGDPQNIDVSLLRDHTIIYQLVEPSLWKWTYSFIIQIYIPDWNIMMTQSHVSLAQCFLEQSTLYSNILDYSCSITQTHLHTEDISLYYYRTKKYGRYCLCR